VTVRSSRTAAAAVSIWKDHVSTVESIASFLPLILVIVVFYFLVIRRTQNQQRAVRETQDALAPGQEIMTTSGLFATVSAVDDDVVVLEVAPGVRTRFARGAVARIVTRPDDPATPSETSGDDPAT
jgi:preprotein translocase subunit YajC